MTKKIPLEVSARHMHISQADLETLFAKNYKLKKLRELNQPLDFACKEVLIIKNGSQELSVRIVGPVRKYTQIEISLTDAFYLKINPPIRKSGDIKFSPGVTLVNKKKRVNIKKGVIIALRHIHCNPTEAKKLRLKNNRFVSVRVEGERGLIFNKVKVRVNKDYRLSMHIDTDEANAAGINQKAKGYLI